MNEEEQSVQGKYSWKNYVLTVLSIFVLFISFDAIYFNEDYFYGFCAFLSSSHGLRYADSVGLIVSIFKGHHQKVDDNSSLQ